MTPGGIGSAILHVSVMVLCLMVAAYPVYRLLALWFDRAISTAEAIIYITLLVFLVVGIMATLGSPLGYVLIAAFVASCVGVPVLNRLADQASLRRMEDQDITEFRMTLVHQPGNKYAHERLARIYWRRRQYDEALTHVEAVLKEDPKEPTFRVLKERLETDRRRAITKAKVCPKCFVENPPDAAACLECGFAFTDPGDLVRMLLGDNGQQALRWAGLSFGLLGLILLLAHVAVLAAGLLFLFGIVCLMLYLYARLSTR